MKKQSRKTPELVCPAGTPSALRVAVDAGADVVYCGFRDETNARNFPGLNFSRAEMSEGTEYAHKHKARVYAAINTFPQAGNTALWHKAIDDAVGCGADALIVADMGLAAYAARMHPETRLHLSVQASASNPDAIRYYCETFNVKRVVLPRVLSIPEITALNGNIPCETEAFVFGGLCVMAEGRCLLSSYATGKSPNMNGVCSPAGDVRYAQGKDGSMASKLGAFTINRFAEGEPAGYPTICKGRFKCGGETGYIFEEPASLDALSMMPELLQSGVAALKIEGRQRGKAYTEAVVKAFRKALSDYARGWPLEIGALIALAEGGQSTAGAYDKTWR
ncbi:MAG: U32 family peptidase [Alphaproteobacteria bacterium]|nr:U32 family peptidase [Alphaproteobacteria bacterium]MDE2336190.1 U32 family peptidase [Alphaproteobacteria bacterium]